MSWGLCRQVSIRFIARSFRITTPWISYRTLPGGAYTVTIWTYLAMSMQFPHNIRSKGKIYILVAKTAFYMMSTSLVFENQGLKTPILTALSISSATNYLIYPYSSSPQTCISSFTSDPNTTLNVMYSLSQSELDPLPSSSSYYPNNPPYYYTIYASLVKSRLILLIYSRQNSQCRTYFYLSPRQVPLMYRLEQDEQNSLPQKRQ